MSKPSNLMATFYLILIYFALISLGLPDSLLGVSWPVMQPEFQVPFGFAGIASMVISGETIVSSLTLLPCIVLAYAAAMLASSEWLNTILLKNATQVKKLGVPD